MTADRWLLGPARARAWDDLRLVDVKLIFLLVTRALSLLRLSRREWWWKDAEILMLRHQLAVTERDRPRAQSRCVIEHGTRRIRILGATEHPVESRVVQQARSLLMDLEDAGTRAKFVLHDRDASFTVTPDSVFQGCGHQGYPLCGPGAADEFGHGTRDRQLPA